MHNKFSNKSPGFTLIELLVIMAFVATTGLISIPFYSRFFTQNAVQNTYNQITAELRKAQLYAMIGKKNGSWGVHNAGTQIILFQGSTYAGRNTAFDEKFNINTNVVITGFTDIIYAQLTGLPSAASTITIKGNNTTKTIIINSQGTINVVPITTNGTYLTNYLVQNNNQS